MASGVSRNPDSSGFVNQARRSWVREAVNKVDPDTVADAFGDPLDLPSFSSGKIEDGDYAVVTYDGSWGAVYFLRPLSGGVPDHAFHGSVVMTHAFVEADPGDTEPEFPETVIKSLVGERFNVEYHRGHEVDGVRVPFFVIKNSVGIDNAW